MKSILLMSLVIGILGLSSCEKSSTNQGKGKTQPAKKSTNMNKDVKYSTMKLIKVNENIFMVKGYPEMPSAKNRGFISCAYGILTSEGWVIIDSLTGPELSKEFISLLEKEKKVGFKYAVITHHHHDHWYGAKTYKDLGIKIIGHENLLKHYNSTISDLILKTLQKRFKGVYTNVVLTPPDVTYKKNHTIKLGDQTIEIMPLKASHSDSDLIVYLPKEKAIFVGDLILLNRIPGMASRNASSKRLVNILEKIKSFDIQYILGGHDKALGKSAIQEALNYIYYLRKGIAKMKEEDLSIEKIKANLQDNPYTKKPLYKLLHNGNIMKIYHELDFEELIDD